MYTTQTCMKVIRGTIERYEGQTDKHMCSAPSASVVLVSWERTHM